MQWHTFNKKDIIMQNVYEILRSNNEAAINDDEVQSFIINALVKTFNMALTLEESFDSLNFCFDNIDIGTENFLNYNFKYGRASVSTSQDVLYIQFNLNDSAIHKLNSPYESKYFIIYVDHFMNYSYADFDKKFGLVFNGKDYAKLRTRYKLYSNHPENILVSNTFCGDNSSFYADHKRTVLSVEHGLSVRYVNMDNQFRSFFSKFLTLCNYESMIFEEVFPEYFDRISKIDTHLDVVNFLNCFEKEYTDHFDVLKAKFTIAGMITI